MLTINVPNDKNIRQYSFSNSGKENFPCLVIGKYSYINNLTIHSGEGNEVINIHIGNYCSIAYDVNFLMNRNHDYESISNSPMLEVKRKLKSKGQILVGHDVWIGNGATVLSGVKIGNGAVIGANTTVTKDIPPYAIVAGNPAKIIKYRFKDFDKIKRISETQWWNWHEDIINQNKEIFGLEINEFLEQAVSIAEKANKQSYEKINYVANRIKYLFYPDLDQDYPIWKKVIFEFISRFAIEDDVSLILRVERNDYIKEISEYMRTITKETEEFPDILIINNETTSDSLLFQDVNFYITTRHIGTMEHINYCESFETKILSGVDIPVFD